MTVADVARGEALAPAVRRPWQWAVERAVDVTVGCALVVSLSPALLLLALLVRATSPGPALFRQVRVGRDGEAIRIRKFRSMRVGAEDELGRLLPLNEAADGPLFKLRDDPRVTPVGRWMRRFSLDELPQLLNVVGGSMSLVGPRPALPDEVARYDAAVRRRLLVKPGLTGLWQVSGRSDLSWSEAIRLDLHYVEHGSVRMNLLILLRTIPAVLSGRGAY